MLHAMTIKVFFYSILFANYTPVIDKYTLTYSITVLELWCVAWLQYYYGVTFPQITTEIEL